MALFGSRAGGEEYLERYYKNQKENNVNDVWDSGLEPAYEYIPDADELIPEVDINISIEGLKCNLNVIIDLLGDLIEYTKEMQKDIECLEDYDITTISN